MPLTLRATIIALTLAALLALIAGAVIAIMGRFLDSQSDDPRGEDEKTTSTGCSPARAPGWAGYWPLAECTPIAA
jgi:hypothetical protein